eukprot:gene19002-20914_t
MTDESSINLNGKQGSKELELPGDVQEFNSIDEVLPYIGELGKYQIILISMLALMILTAGFPVLIMFFAAQNPPWTCVANSTRCNLTGSFTSKSPEYEQRCQMPRSEWKFTKPKSYSIVTQFDIHCETEYYIYLSTSLLFIGWGIGSVIFGYLADRYGRFKVLVVSVIGIIVITFLSAFAPNYALFAVSRLVVGIFKPGTVVGAYIVAGELVGPRYRPLAGTVMWILFAISLVLTGVKAYFVREWKTLIMICSAPYSFVFLFFLCGRKKSVISGLALGGIFCTIVGGLSTSSEDEEKWKILRVIFGLCGKFCITLSFNALYMWSMEIYPTCIRGEGMGFVQITSRVGSALAPWVAKWLNVFHPAIPFSLMGGLSIVAAFSLLCLPETGDQKTMETVDDLIGGRHSTTNKAGIFIEPDEKSPGQETTTL